MSLQDTYNYWSRGNWAEPSPRTCPCRGTGWTHTDLDTYHKCRIHHRDQRHPEDEPEDDLPEAERTAYYAEVQAEEAAAKTANYRAYFSYLRTVARRFGYTADNATFARNCRDAAPDGELTARQWCEAAEAIVSACAPNDYEVN